MKTISLCLTVHNRPPAVSKAVADSLRLPGNQPDELILVLDRPTQEALEGAHAAYDDLPFPVLTVTIPGNQGGWGRLEHGTTPSPSLPPTCSTASAAKSYRMK